MTGGGRRLLSGYGVKAAATCALPVAGNAAAWVWAWAAFADRPALLGTALLAYTLGVRHAFDADHIAAIDNVVRKLMQEGRRSHSVGLFFSLGHSTIVGCVTIAIALAAAAAHSRLAELRMAAGAIGTAVSALFLVGIGVANLLVLKAMWSALERARGGESIVEKDLHSLPRGGGPLARIYRPVLRLVSRPSHMYPVGFLFGLGFDTASEVALLGIAATQTGQGISLGSMLILPAMFAAGMCLMDTADSALMTGVYGWAFVSPIRKLWYNLTITAASVAVAFFIAALESLALLGGALDSSGRAWIFIRKLNDNLACFGLVAVGIFVASWILSRLVYRARGYAEPPARAEPQR